MPVCEGCGGSYDNKFKFCPHCGRAKPKPVSINIHVTSDDEWETCEITLAWSVTKEKFLGIPKNSWLVFEAKAIGAQGRYSAGCSERLEESFLASRLGLGDYHYENGYVLHRVRVEPKVDALIKKLVSDGWQSIGRGQEWYNERFRRKIKK